MYKALPSARKSKKVIDKYPYPSRFGSHRCMVYIQPKESPATSWSPCGKLVVCEDEFGVYTTEVSRLDNGMADPNRYARRDIRDKLCGS